MARKTVSPSPSKGRHLFLLDANVLIRAHEDYYDVNRVPQFWEWLIEMGKANRIKIPVEIHGEIKDAKGPLGEWARDRATKDALILDSSASRHIARVIGQGYASDLDEDEIETIGKDPNLIAHALVEPDCRVVVSKENSKPNAQRANKKEPDVCRALKVQCVTDFHVFRELDFTTRRQGD